MWRPPSLNLPPARGGKRAWTGGIWDVDYEDDGSILSFLEDRGSYQDSTRMGLEAQWYQNVAMYLGMQYHTYSTSSGQLELEYAPSDRARLVVNLLIGVARKVVSKALRQRPHWVTLPATEDKEDLDVSVVATKLLRYYWRYLRMDRILFDAFTWMAVTGNAFLSVVWDPDLGPELQVTQEDIDQIRDEVKTSRQKEITAALEGGLRLGDLRVDVWSPFEIRPDPDCMRLDQASYIEHTTVRPLGWLLDRFGEKAEGLTPDADETASLTRFYSRRIQNFSGMAGDWTTSSTGQTEGVVTRELWVNPTKKYPKGYHCVVAGGRVLEKEREIKNPQHRAPFVHILEIPVPGRFWGTCALEQAIPLQMDYNSARSRLVETRNLCSNPKVLDPLGGLSKQSMTSEPGEVIEYTPPWKPEYMGLPSLPEFVPRLLELTRRDFEDVTAIHDVTNAKAPSNVRAGVAIAQLQEQDDQMLAPSFQNAEGELGKLGALALQLLAENIKEDRVIRIVGDSRTVESFTFTGNKLYGPNSKKPGVNYFDVEVQLGSQLPLSKQTRAQYIIDLVNTGILDRVADNKQIKEMLGLGQTEESILNADQLDKQMAREESVMMIRMAPVDINPFDADLIHVDEHRKFQKQPAYARVRNPQIDQIFEDHIQKHELRLQQMMQAQQQAQMGGQEQPPPQQIPEPQIPPEPSVAESPQALQDVLAELQAAGLKIPNELLDQEGVLTGEEPTFS